MDGGGWYLRPLALADPLVMLFTIDKFAFTGDCGGLDGVELAVKCRTKQTGGNGKHLDEYVVCTKKVRLRSIVDSTLLYVIKFILKYYVFCFRKQCKSHFTIIKCGVIADIFDVGTKEN